MMMELWMETGVLMTAQESTLAGPAQVEAPLLLLSALLTVMMEPSWLGLKTVTTTLLMTSMDATQVAKKYSAMIAQELLQARPVLKYQHVEMGL